MQNEGVHSTVTTQGYTFTLNSGCEQIFLSDDLRRSLGMSSCKISTGEFLAIIKNEYKQTVKQIFANAHLFTGSSFDIKLTGSRLATIHVIGCNDTCLEYRYEITLSTTPNVSIPSTGDKIADSQTILQKVYDNLTVGIKLYDRNGILIEANRVEMEMMGVTDKKQILGINLFDNPNIPIDTKTRIRNGENMSFTLVYDFNLAKSYYNALFEGIKYIKIYSSVIKDKNDNINGYMLMSMDVTNRVNTNKQLHSKLELLAKIYDSMPVGVEVYDKDGFLTEANKKEMDIFGISSLHNVLGYNIFDDVNFSDETKRRIRNGEEFDFTINYDFTEIGDLFVSSKKHTDKPNLVYRVAQIKSISKEPDGFLVIISDNTEKELVRRKLKDSDIFISAMAEYAKVGVGKFDLLSGSGITSAQWNKNIRKDATRTLSEDEITAIMHPEDSRLLYDVINKMLRGKLFTYKFDVRLNDNNGGWRWNSVYMKITDYRPQEGVITLHAVNIDITEKKETEATLIEACHRAEENDRQKSSFLANMSHEIRTPLNAIVGFSTLLAEKYKSEDEQNYGEIISKNNELLLQLISDILDLSEIESGMLMITNSEFRLSDFINDISRIYALRNTGDVKLEILPIKDNPTIYTDKTRLTQVVSNFINNALKFTHVGYIRLGTVITDNSIEIYVEDSGVGIKKELIPSIFDRYVKLDSFTPGTGLGLPICKNIMEQLGGSIGVDSEFDKGSKFWLKLQCNAYDSVISRKSTGN